jgi:hypothetical protein
MSTENHNVICCEAFVFNWNTKFISDKAMMARVSDYSFQTTSETANYFTSSECNGFTSDWSRYFTSDWSCYVTSDRYYVFMSGGGNDFTSNECYGFTSDRYNYFTSFEPNDLEFYEF